MKIQGSKFYYYVWLVLVFITLLTCTLIFLDLFNRGRTDAATAMSILNACFFAYSFFAIKKYVYVEERGNKSFLIGNIFFNEVISDNQIVIKKIFIANMYKIKFKDKVYWFISVNVD